MQVSMNSQAAENAAVVPSTRQGPDWLKVAQMDRYGVPGSLPHGLRGTQLLL